MKKIIYSFLIGTVLLVACDPIETRVPMGGAITADQLNISATPVVVDGKNSNKIIMENHSPVLTLWDYGMGTSNRAYEEVLLALTGENKIIFTGLNADGTYITKELTVQVDELSFEVPKEWALLCGTGDKEWVWDDTKPAVWGNGGYKGNVAPGWWTVGVDAMEEQTTGEGKDASMIFSINGSKLYKKKSDGTTVKGSFAFDMSKQTLDDAGNVWGKGKLSMKSVTVLSGKAPNSGNAPVYEYDILNLTETEMALSWPEPDQGSWGTAWFWMFRAK